MNIRLLASFAALWLLEETVAVKKWSSLKIRYNLFNTYPNQEAFIDMPKSTEDAGLMDFQIVRPEKEFCYPMDLYCLRNDPSLCLFFDKSGTVAGMQISYPEADVLHIDQNEYDFSNPNFIKTNFFNIPAYSFRAYFTNPKELTWEGRKNASEVAEGLWAELDGQLVRFDVRCQPNSPLIGEFDMQGCYAKIGHVFPRKFNERSHCKDVFFVYMLYESGSMVGFGHGIPGRASPGPRYDVYNHPAGPAVQTLLPNAPPCLYDLAGYGFSAVNVFFIDDPWNIRCPKCLCH